MELGLIGKKILIVGASKGIGRGIVMGFAHEGTNIVGIARTEELLKDVKQEALKEGAASFEYEISDIINGDCKALAQMLLDKYGLFDVIVHNVGTSLCGNNHLGDSEDWIKALRTNALASIDMNSVFLPAMIERGSGHVVHISSISAVMQRGNPLYASSKTFLNAYVTTVGRMLAPTGVVMCSVMPGAVVFEGSYWDKFIKEGHPRVQDFLRHHQAVNRFGTPEEIANVVVFMASNRSSFMQATNIPVDGANM